MKALSDRNRDEAFFYLRPLINLKWYNIPGTKLELAITHRNL
jgi:hypothetical protein